jgi:hypothetical protein
MVLNINKAEAVYLDELLRKQLSSHADDLLFKLAKAKRHRAKGVGGEHAPMEKSDPDETGVNHEDEPSGQKSDGQSVS